MPREEKSKKYLTFKNQVDSLNYCSQPFSKEVYSLLKLYVPQSIIDQELKSIKKELPSQKVTELCDHLNVNNYEPRTEIYS